MSEQLTPAQQQVLDAKGKIIVSASAGSGKTFIMIKKLVRLIVEEGVDVQSILAVTFGNAAAAQIREKLRKALVSKVAEVKDAAQKKRLKEQLALLPSASVCTIHAFCSRLIKTYFYALDLDGSFQTISSDDSVGVKLRQRALDQLFDRLYAEDNADLALLLSVYRRRSDSHLRELVLNCYDDLRNQADYRTAVIEQSQAFTQRDFDMLCTQYALEHRKKLQLMEQEVLAFIATFHVQDSALAKKYEERFDEMLFAIDRAIAARSPFEKLPPFCGDKPRDKGDDKAEGERYKAFVAPLKKAYMALYADFASYEEELAAFQNSGAVAQAFARLMLAFDDEYTAVKKDEGKLDYNDLEHYALQLLQRSEVAAEVQARYTHVYVDEYQDVNPLQEEIINHIVQQNVFLVGDVKQAIYGFRGSRSAFFSQKFKAFEGGEGQALVLPNNFRSSDGVLEFVNTQFSEIMREDTDGIDYAQNPMMGGGKYPQGAGESKVLVFSNQKEQEEKPTTVYSVQEHGVQKGTPSGEGLAIAQLIHRLTGQKYYDVETFYDVESASYRPITLGDICILTRKADNAAVHGIVRALVDSGIPVSGVREGGLKNVPEVKTLIDVLSYLDNAEQDVPLVTTMLSPVGDFSDDELAAIRILTRGQEQSIKEVYPVYEKGVIPFRVACEWYAQNTKDELAQKLVNFFAKVEDYRRYATIVGAASLLNRLLEETGWEAAYARGNGQKLKNVRRFIAEAYNGSGELSLSEFAQKLRAEYKLEAPDAPSSDSVTMMTMHKSKGLEFPIVILANVAATFRGVNDGEIVYHESFGFVPYSYQQQTHVKSITVLRRLVGLLQKKEDLINEINVYYVACTRAKYATYVMTNDTPEYSRFHAATADCYADMTDFSKCQMVVAPPYEGQESQTQTLISEPDETFLKNIGRVFRQPYAHQDGVDLPVKTSASAILQMQSEQFDEPTQQAQPLFDESEGGTVDKTDAQTGTAYHRYLELCDFARNTPEQIAQDLAAFTSSGELTPEQAALLNPQKLHHILNMKVFGGLQTATLWKEQEFLCKLPACELWNTPSQDEILLQGAIDLLVQKDGTYHVVDYKYSHKSAPHLKDYYQKQLTLYCKAVALITKTPVEEIHATIVNIFTGDEVPLW